MAIDLKFSEVRFDDLRSLGAMGLSEDFYIDMVESFVQTGKFSKFGTNDPLCNYLFSVMSDPVIKTMVLSDPVQAHVFQDNMMMFVDASLKRDRFRMNMKRAEYNGVREAVDWSPQRKRDGWNALVDQLEAGYSKYGFRSAFYRNMFRNPDNIDNDELWESLCRDYEKALMNYLSEQSFKDIESGGDNHTKHLENIMNRIPDYLKQNGISNEEFHITWRMMGGEWYERDFRMFLKYARMQASDSIQQIASLMGRTLDSNGMLNVWSGSGGKVHLNHSAKSDIQGVTFGNNLDSLMPMELTMIADEALEELFYQKYSTGKLQSFLHKSEQLNPNRKVERRKARPKGPMIVCVDTSGSMVGGPLDTAHATVLKLHDIAKSEKRKLYIIAFSVSATPMDVTTDRIKLMEFLNCQASGDTEPTKMMNHVFHTLERNPDFMSADVLLISDFKMPLVTQTMLDRISDLRKTGTCFYGLQTGPNAENLWTAHFDRIVS